MSNQTSKIGDERYECYLMRPDLYYMHFFQDAECSLEDIKTIIDHQKEIGVQPPIMRIMHAEMYVSITNEARKYTEQHAPDVKAEAYVIPSLSQKILFNLYIKFRKNNHPINAFESLEDAIEWLDKQ